MTQDEKWQVRYNEVVEFVETNRRISSKHRVEEHGHLNCWNSIGGRSSTDRGLRYMVLPFLRLLVKNYG